jgi:Axonemal dynein light chain
MSGVDDKREDQRSLIKYARPVIVSTMGKRGKDKTEGKDIATTEIEDILNSILPPREYTKDKQQLHIESVSSTAATESDVIQLQHVSWWLTAGTRQETAGKKGERNRHLCNQRRTVRAVFR